MRRVTLICKNVWRGREENRRKHWREAWTSLSEESRKDGCYKENRREEKEDEF